MEEKLKLNRMLVQLDDMPKSAKIEALRQECLDLIDELEEEEDEMEARFWDA